MKYVAFPVVAYATVLAALPLTSPKPSLSARFYEAIRANDLAAVRRLIQQKQVNVRDADGDTPLLFAAADGSLESMKMLLDAGANPNLANKVGATPLMWSIGEVAKVKSLLAKGANVNARARAGVTPLELAAQFDGSTEIVDMLIDRGAKVNDLDDFKVSALEQAAGTNNLEITKDLLNRGADVNSVDATGFSPLLAATGIYGNPARNGAVVELLIRHGAKVNQTTIDKTGGEVANGPLALGRFTALHEAAQLADVDAVAALVEDGADVNALDVRGMNPLVWAVATDHANPKLVKLLIDAGAETKVAKEWAIRYQNPAILPLFGLAPQKPRTDETEEKPAPSSFQSKLRLALTRALAGGQNPASNFERKGGCISCHAENLMGLAVAAAKPLGIKANYKLESQQALLVASGRGFNPNNLFLLQGIAAGVNGADYLTQHMYAAGLPHSLGTDSLIYFLIALQTRDGNWPIGEARPPINDGTISLTARAIRALRDYPIPARKPQIDACVARAAKWLAAIQPLTTEDRITQILGLRWAGQAPSPQRIRQLIARQRAGGGWGQTDTLPADAYATGEAIWALRDSGMAASDPVIRRAVSFLLRTQQPDGTWHVVSRSLPFQPYFESGFPYGHDQWVSQAATSFAAIGLSHEAQ